MNYSEVIEYVKKMTAENGRPSNYPFRSRYEHTMRVYRWAIKLQAKLGGDIDIIALAALLHDIGWDSERPHEEVGAELAVDFLDELGIVCLRRFMGSSAYRAWVGLGNAIGKHMVVVVPICLVLGIFAPGAFSPLLPAVPFLFAIMSFQSSLNIKSV